MADDEDHAPSKDYFRGRADEDYSLWKRRRRVEAIMEVAGGKTEASQVMATYRLLREGAANTAAAAMTDTATTLPWTTMAGLFTTLDAAYGASTEKTQADAVEAMKVLRQKGDMEEYIQEFIRLKGLAGFTDAQAVPLMRTGLRKPVRGLLAAQEFTTVSALAGAARRAEKDAPTEQPRGGGAGRGGGPRRGGGRGRRGKAATTEKRREDMSAAEKREADRDIECFGCGKKGHRRADCRQKKGKKASRRDQNDDDPGWEDEDLAESGKE